LIEKFDNKAWNDSEMRVSLISRIYSKLINELSALAYNYRGGGVFSFNQYKKKQSDKIFEKFVAEFSIAIKTGVANSYLVSDQKAKFIASRFKGVRIGHRNADALDKFINRRIAGMNLSDRIWRITNQARREIELAIDISIREGNSAAELARLVKKQLNEPDRLYRRVRDKGGNLVLSKAAKAYKPGIGVYRSSIKNAQRLARTEINIAYRTADYERWQELDFVVGYEIKLSNNPNHCPMCERLKGKYPKWFKFTGWHPQCRCFMIPILISDSDFQKNLLKKKYSSSKEVKVLPKNFTDWIRANKEKINKSAPYFIKDNPKVLESS
jgi:hypothetical protein